MKIDQQNINQSGGAGGAQQTGGAQQVKGGRGASSSKSAYGLGSDSVELSSLSEAVRAYTTESPERSHAEPDSAMSQLILFFEGAVL